MNNIVFHEFAWTGRGKAEMERSVEFDLCRLTLSGNEVRTLQKLNRFLQPRVRSIGRHHQCHNLNGRPVHQFCQRRDHSDLSFFPSLSGSPGLWRLIAITSPLSSLVNVTCVPYVLKKKTVSDSG